MNLYDVMKSHINTLMKLKFSDSKKWRQKLSMSLTPQILAPVIPKLLSLQHVDTLTAKVSTLLGTQEGTLKSNVFQ